MWSPLIFRDERAVFVPGVIRRVFGGVTNGFQPTGNVRKWWREREEKRKWPE